MTVASSSTTSVPARTPIQITSRELSRMLRGKTPAEKAAIARLFHIGIYVLAGLPSKALAARIAKVPGTYLTAACGHTGRRGARKRTIKRLVSKYSPATLLRALDLATAPTNGNGAANGRHA